MAKQGSDEVLKSLPFSDIQKKKILNGEIIQWTTKEASHRELAMGMALLIKDEPEDLIPLFREAVGFKIMGDMGAVTAYSQITGKGTVEDFAALHQRERMKPSAF